MKIDQKYIFIRKSNEKTFEANSGCFINGVITKLNIGAPTISHHLKELSAARLIFTEKRGKFLVAKVNQELLNEICNLLTFKRNEES